MSDPKHDSLGDLVSAAGLPDITGINLPAPVKKSLWRALGKLIMGAVDVPVAYLEAQAGKIRAHGKGSEAVTLAAAAAAAQRFGDDPMLADRAVHHFGEKIVREQRNREAVARTTMEAIAASPPEAAPDDIIDEDWLTEFSELAAKKSNEEIRLILGRILAGEVAKPGSFSAATLQLLATLSQATARKFHLLCGMSIADVQGYTFVITAPFPNFQKNGLEELGVSYSAFLNLQSAGLLTPALTSQVDLTPYQWVRADFAGQPFALRLTDPSKTFPSVQISVFSTIGHELRRVIPMQANPTYEKKLRDWLTTHSVAIQAASK